MLGLGRAHVGGMLGTCWLYGPSWAYVGLVVPMLSLLALWRAMLGYVGPSGVGPMLGLFWAHVGPMLGPCWAHVGPMLGHAGPRFGNLADFRFLPKTWKNTGF